MKEEEEERKKKKGVPGFFNVARWHRATLLHRFFFCFFFC